ncbi:MAG: transposase [Deltaproteobacteria bacterium]|nr:transposase [Deltaproteobacteria bacterium]
MPRNRRIALADHPHVVIARGNNGDPVFFDERDYQAYLYLLRELVREQLCVLYAWCLTRNAVRLVVAPRRIGLAQAVQRLHGSHARRINQRRGRTGHLFEGRFRSLIIPEAKVAEAVRWVHLWPVRDGRVRRAETWPWSSHRAYAARGDQWGDLVDAWAVLERYGATLPAAQRAFARFVEAGALDNDELPIEQVIAGVGGDRKFAESVLAEAGVVWRGRRRPALPTLARRVSLLMNVHVDDVMSAARQQDLVMARRLLATSAVRQAGRSVTEVADFLHRDKGQVSRLVQQGMSQMRTDEGFRTLLDAMRQRGGHGAPTVE